ncbi:hypothetical protein T484DRAFT_1810169 [Baffinella frigidus]|nr:hypothetical protein T484DRAFT_1810169 [Cryptophyta sp. CCMP2293]
MILLDPRNIPSKDIDIFREHVAVYERTAAGQRVRILSLSNGSKNLSNGSKSLPLDNGSKVLSNGSKNLPLENGSKSLPLENGSKNEKSSKGSESRSSSRLAVEASRVVTLGEASSGVGITISPGAKCDFDAPVPTAISPGANCDFDAPVLRVSACSPISPPAVYDISLKDASASLLQRRPFPGSESYREGAYECYLEWAVSDDGTKVPMTVTHKKSLPRDGTRPAILFCYGAYGQCLETDFECLETDFEVGHLALIDRGWSIVMCHVRGGGELGLEYSSTKEEVESD